MSEKVAKRRGGAETTFVVLITRGIYRMTLEVW